jgi:hypothetical protein
MQQQTYELSIYEMFFYDQLGMLLNMQKYIH